MPHSPDRRLLDVVLDAWDRNNTILINLLRAVPPAGLEVRPMDSSPRVAELFTHIQFVRLIFVSEDAPEFATAVPEDEWVFEQHPERIAQMLNQSAAVVREVVRSAVEQGRAMQVHYDDPIVFLQRMIWHEAYHHGQIKLALKLAGSPISDEQAGPIIWGIWMRTTSSR